VAAVVGVLPFSVTYPWEVAAPTAPPGNSAEPAPSRIMAMKNMLIAGSNIGDEVQADATLNSDKQGEQSGMESGLPSGQFISGQQASTDFEPETADQVPGRSFWQTMQAAILYVLRTTNYHITLPILFLAVLPMVCSVRILGPLPMGATDPCPMAARFCYWSAVLISALAVSVEIGNRCLAFWHVSIPFLDSVQPLRGTRLVAPLSIIALVLACMGRGGLQILNTRRGRWALVAAIFPVLVSLAAGEYVFQIRYQPVREAAVWAKANTPPEALFLVDPPGAVAFRYWAERPVVWSHHDAVCIRGPLRYQARQEIRGLESAYTKNQSSELIRLARRYRANYVYYPAEPGAAQNLAWQTAGPFYRLSTAIGLQRLARPLKNDTKRLNKGSEQRLARPLKADSRRRF
jgi:hypothetical protein